LSTRLDLALQELADAAGATSGFGDPDTSTTVQTVARLTARVRRRRTVRGAGTAAVAASAAGAVALVAPQLTRDVSPAGDPDAAPGTCRSSVTKLPSGPRDPLGVELGHRAGGGVPVVAPAGAGEDLGTWQGRSADLVVNVSQIPDAGVGATRLRFLVTQEGVVKGLTQGPLSVTPTSTDEVLRTHLATPAPATTEDLPVYPLEDAGHRWQIAETSTGVQRVAQSAALGFTACDGTGKLPSGTYQVYATIADSVGTARGSAGPWDVEIAQDDEATSHDLPDGFPADVPLIPGRLVSADQHGSGWTVEIATPGNDRATIATTMLAHEGLRGSGVGDWDGYVLPAPFTNVLFSGAGVELPGWAVLAAASRTADGEPSVVYTLTRRP